MRRFFDSGAIILIALAALVWGAGNALQQDPRTLAQPSGLDALDRLNAITTRFGQLETVMFVVRGKPPAVLFSPAALAEFKTLTQTLDRLGACRSVTSIFNLQTIRLSDEESEVTPLVARLPTNPSEAEALKAAVLAHPYAPAQLLARDGSAALVLCAIRPNDGWGTLVDFAARTSPEHLTLTLSGPLGVALATGRDMALTALWILLLGVPMAAFSLALEAHLGQRFKRRGALLFLTLLALLGGRSIWEAAREDGSALGFLLSNHSRKAHEALTRLTEARELLLVEVSTPLQTAQGVQRLAGLCTALAALNIGQVQCPTDVLTQVSAAMTGAASLPSSDEQVRALWFFAGERPELAALITSDKRYGLVRLLLQRHLVDDWLEHGAATMSAVLEAAKTRAVNVSVAGMPIVETWLRAAMLLLGVTGVLGCAAAHALGRRWQWGSLALGAGLATATAVSQVGGLTLLLLTLSAWTLFATLGASRKP